MNRFSIFIKLLSFVATTIAAAISCGDSAKAEDSKPLKALLIAGGCCHDYAGQQRALAEGIQDRANVQVDVYWTDDASTNPSFPIFDDPKWAEGYDVIIHDECAASNTDVETVKRILETHKTIPAVHLHCAMHCFRNGTDLWFKHLGLQSNSHGPQKPIAISFVNKDHPITETLANWTTEDEELYNNVKVFDAVPIAMGKQGNAEAIVAWINEKHGARSFSTTIGHNTTTVSDPRYLDLVTRGLLWSCGKLNDDYLTKFEGENKVIFVDSKEAQKQKQMKMLAEMPDGATLVKPSASSVQGGNEIVSAFDGDMNSRWCANGGSYPQWLQFEFEESRSIEAIKIDWEFEKAYRYKIVGSDDGKNWTDLIDASENSEANRGFEDFPKNTKAKFIRIEGIAGDGWCSIREVSVKGKDLEKLWPAGASGKPTLADPNTKQGNIVPRIEPISEEKEAEILKDVKVPEGFEVSLFAAPPAVNYPVFVAAAPDGTLFVSSDGNGSLGRDPERGRVIRLQDTDGDGRADKTNVFCQIDAPRGVVWDHDRLFLMHPPNLSVFIDKDGDGVSDEQKILVKNLAFGYDKRPADHTTNGLSMGVDGWLYVAGGDFGFIDAEGTDGKKLTHRGGGVIRVRPDGTDLEIYSTGTRNILEVAISPRMDMFARDNTNDGGGWDVRFHHFTGGDDHGYPRLYKRFPDECIPPLADYGGGSGCGAVYLDEPGFGERNDAPLTADWGRGALFHHAVEPAGATFKETRAPESFVNMTRPTDADVDGMSRLYCASWRGATFKWNGPDVGYIICVKPKNFVAKPLPDFAKLSDDELTKLFDSPSYRRRMAAQRELVRRGNSDAEKLLTNALAARSETRNLVRSLQNEASDEDVIEELKHDDPIVVHVAIRSLAKRGAVTACLKALDDEASNRPGLLRSLAMMHASESVGGLISRYGKSKDAEYRKLILTALCRLHFMEAVWTGQSWGTRPDTRGPYYEPKEWSESPKIIVFLKDVLDNASPEDAAFLANQMHLNRIESTEALDRMLQLASKDSSLVPAIAAQLAAAKNTPAKAVDLLIAASNDSSSNPQTLSDSVTALSRVQTATESSTAACLKAIVRLEKANAQKELRSAQNAFLNSRGLEASIESIEVIASEGGDAMATWAEAALLSIAARKNGSPESVALAKGSIEAGWQRPDRQLRLMQAAAKVNSHVLDDQIVEAMTDSDPEIAKAARDAAKRLKLLNKKKDKTPKLATIDVERALAMSIKRRGDIEHGKQLFTKATCAACHTVSKDLPQIGPYLGNIAATYKRHELAAAILQPNKTIAQGFATTSIETFDGLTIVGFVTLESADEVTLRDNAGKEYVVKKDDIEFRDTLKTSVMPEGILKDYSVHDLASILDYLQSLKE